MIYHFRLYSILKCIIKQQQHIQLCFGTFKCEIMYMERYSHWKSNLLCIPLVFIVIVVVVSGECILWIEILLER